MAKINSRPVCSVCETVSESSRVTRDKRLAKHVNQGYCHAARIINYDRIYLCEECKEQYFSAKRDWDKYRKALSFVTKCRAIIDRSRIAIRYNKMYGGFTLRSYFPDCDDPFLAVEQIYEALTREGATQYITYADAEVYLEFHEVALMSIEQDMERSGFIAKMIDLS